MNVAFKCQMNRETNDRARLKPNNDTHFGNSSVIRNSSFKHEKYVHTNLSSILNMTFECVHWWPDQS